MPQQYTSFLIRCWQREGGKHQIKVEHIQSGETTQAATLAAVMAWIEAHWDAPTAAPGEAPDPQQENRSTEPLEE